MKIVVFFQCHVSFQWFRGLGGVKVSQLCHVSHLNLGDHFPIKSRWLHTLESQFEKEKKKISDHFTLVVGFLPCYIYLDLPFVRKCVPFHPKNLPKGRNLMKFTYREDPGMISAHKDSN